MALATLIITMPTLTQATESSPNDAGLTSLEEVMVTARRREERLRDVPVAASAITEEMLQSLVLEGADDYLRQVPSATLVTSGPEYLNDITIRGQGSGRLGFSETATGLFRDGMYNAGGGFGGRSLSRMDVFDIDRIEVLRGPQGALFGRNSVGGAVNIVANRVGDELQLRGTVRAANNDRRDIEAVANLPLSERVGLRIASLYNDQDGGFVVNETTGHELDAQRYRGARAVLDFNVTDALTLGAFYEYYDALAPAFANLGQRATRIDGSVLDPGPYRRADMNREGGADIEQHYAMLNADYTLPWATLSAKVSFVTRDGGRSNEDVDHYAGHSSIDVTPGAAVGGPDYTSAQYEDYSRTGAQLYLVSQTSGPVSWLVGVEGLWSQSDVMNDPDFCPQYTGGLLPTTPGCFVGQAGTLAATGATVRNAARLAMLHDEFSEDLTSYSLFGSMDWQMTERLKLGLELRVQRDRKEFGFLRYSEDPLIYFGAGAPPAGMLAPIAIDPDGTGPRTAAPVQFCPPWLNSTQCSAGLEAVRMDQDREWTFWTPAASVHYAVTDEQTLYARVATGDRPGGFNTNPAATTVRSDFGGTLIYEPEKATSFEVGWKGSLFDGAIEGEAAVFYVVTDDVQVVSAPSATARGFILQNAGDAYVYGGELELRNVTPLGPGRLITSLALSSQAGKFKDGASALLDINGDNVPDRLDLGGNDVPRLRDYQATLNLAYTAPVSAALSMFGGVSAQTADGGFENPDNARDYEGYTLFDARLGLQGDRWKVSLFGRNLGDERYLLNIVGGNNFWSDGRTYGVELSMTY
jgi:outer membrane receptor protein involved in Fe transport